MKRLILLAAFFVLAAPALYAQQQPDLGTDAQREAGKVTYDQKCAHCHGYNGDAESVATAYLRPTPRDFTSGNYKFRSTASGELPTTEDIKRSIRDGMPYTSMPAWQGILSESDITNLAYYIKSFDNDFSGPYGTPEVITIQTQGYDESKLARGREVFEANQCADCHGTNGRGNGESAAELMDDWGYPIRPADMTKRWTFRASATREDIYRTFTTGLNGTPMPSYQQTITEEDRWALVDYVWSLSRDEPDYGTVVTAQGATGAIDISQGAALFENVPGTYFPIVGQIVEPGREFYPGVNGVEVKAVYDQEDIAVMLSWNDMTAETSGSNSLTMDVPLFDPAMADSAAADSAVVYSDAVALLLPSEVQPGIEKPYFMFGDSKNPMDIWYTDLATDNAAVFMGKGIASIEQTDQSLERYANYDDGTWTVIFKRKRLMDSGLSFEEGAFTPITFSVWDGFNQERGNKRGLSAWYHVYLSPLETESAALPMAKWALITLLIELGLIGGVRWRSKKEAVTA